MSKFDDIYSTIERRLHSSCIERILSRSKLFDNDFYLAKYPDVRTYAGGPLQHYVRFGAAEGRAPHELFNAEWYIAQYPEVATRCANPLLHYLKNADLKPNPYFDGHWYRQTYPDVKAAGVNPLRHYIDHGANEGRDPSPGFSTSWYVQQNPDIAKICANPLGHFLQHGLTEGRSPVPVVHGRLTGASVMQSEIKCVKQPSTAAEIGLFVAHSPSGKLKPHVAHYLSSLREAGVAVTLIVAADGFFEPDFTLLTLVDGLFVRRNEGYDFAAWAHVLILMPGMLECEILYLLNDSLIGPFNQLDFDALLARARASSADLIGLTENHERGGWHLQSYFLALKKSASSSLAFRRFIDDVTTLENKDDVINQYELRLAPALRAGGYECVVLFPSESTRNPTIYDWKGLIDRGFPFIKMMVLREALEDVDTTGWEQILAARGYDPVLATTSIDSTRPEPSKAVTR